MGRSRQNKPCEWCGKIGLLYKKQTRFREASKIIAIIKANPGVVTTDGEHPGCNSLSTGRIYSFTEHN